MAERVPMTPQGAIRLRELLTKLKEERPRISKDIETAREHGDLSENAEYHSAREKQSFIEGRIADLEDKMARAEIIDPKKIAGDTVKFGAVIHVVDEDTDEELTYQIVGEYEADTDVRAGHRILSR